MMHNAQCTMHNAQFTILRKRSAKAITQCIMRNARCTIKDRSLSFDRKT